VLEKPARMTKGSPPTDDIATAVPSLVWFDRWSIVLLVTVGVDILLALGLQFRVVTPLLTGPAEAMIFISFPVMLVAAVGWAYTSMRFWAQLRRGQHVTRAERRRRAWAYVLALGAAALVVVAEVLGAQNKLWLWAYVPAASLVALGYTMRPRKRVRTRKSRVTEAQTGRPQR
jgi:hypothetical protein